MSTTERGRAAEAAAAAYLEARGYRIVERNWRTRFHEVDLIARRDALVCFIEVKYRATTRYGDGFSMISVDKAARLRRAALAWTQLHHYDGDYRIDVASVSGPLDALVVELLPNAITD